MNIRSTSCDRRKHEYLSDEALVQDRPEKPDDESVFNEACDLLY